MKLVITHPVKNDYYTFELYQTGGSCYLKVNASKQLQDSIYVIDNARFNEISELAVSISSSDILRGMNPDNPSIWVDATGCTLEIKIAQESIVYNVLAPTVNTDERNLRGFLQLCKEIILSAKMNPKRVLRR